MGERRKGGEKDKQREFSIYISNLPEELDIHGLKGIFQKAGRISDVYIPQKRTRRFKLRFGFVSFWRKEDAIMGMNMFNNTTITGNRVAVDMAKFQKGEKSWRRQKVLRAPKQRSKQNWKWEEKRCEGKERGSPVQTNQTTHTWQKTMIGEVNTDFEEWLKRSLVCTTEEPKDLATLTSAIIHGGYGRCTKICALSCFKYILTYPTEEAMKEALNNQEELKLWFYDIQRWSRCDSCETRKEWLEVFGVPPRGWCWENYNRISGLWGKLITLGKSIARTESFKSMKMLIATDVFT